MVKIVGHRGAAGYAPENTLRSFETAIALGCDRAELDVHLSKDGEVIVIHDADVSRLTDGKGKVKDMTRAEIKKLRCAEGQRIPTLQEVIDLCKNNISLQRELKAEGVAEPVYRLIRKNNIEHNTVLISFDVKLLREIKKLGPKLPVGLLFDKAPRNLWKLAKEIPLEYIGPRYTAVTKKLVESAHAHGLSVYVYHVNEKKVGDRLTAFGVDELGTDFPKLFLSPGTTPSLISPLEKVERSLGN